MSSLFDFDQEPDAYAVMGNPIQHSRSPQIHAAFARQTGERIIYTAIQVDPGGFEQAVGNFFANGGKGLNVTVPYKREAWQLATIRGPEAERAGAINTLLMQEDGHLRGHNTDGIGLTRDLLNNHQRTLRGQHIVLLGAGGAARGVLQPLLAELPAKLTIANRTPARAHELAADFTELGSVAGCSFDELAGQQADIIINATAASLQGELPPLPDSLCDQRTSCYDMMYAADPTPFMLWAESHQAQFIADGLGMLVEQAAESFYLWRGLRPETAEVISLIREQLEQA